MSGVTHWHVQRHGEDDDVYATADLVTALGYAGDELERAAEHEHEGITAYGDVGDYESAYRAHERSERFAGLAASASTIYRQGSSGPADRAPLYAGPDETRNQALITGAGLHVVTEINSGGPDGFRVWECPVAECAPTDD